jgi:hypothetical protein
MAAISKTQRMVREADMQALGFGEQGWALEAAPLHAELWMRRFGVNTTELENPKQLERFGMTAAQVA